MSKLAQVVQQGSDCYVIAEAGLNHNGSIEIARKLIDVAAIAGADAVKFQKRTVQKLAIKSLLDAQDDRFPAFGKTYREIREHLELSMDGYRELKAYTAAKGLDFIVTAFDTDAVDFLEDLGVEVYKLASHNLTNLELLECVARLHKPTLLSTGMAELEEVDHAVDIFRNQDTPLILLHCVSAYPTPLAECNLAMIDVLKRRYALPVGYSGHELGYLPTLVAVAMGAKVVERHFTLDKEMVGFDHKISLTPDELIAMVRDIQNIAKICGTGEKRVSETEWITRRKYHVSMVSAADISAGATLTEAMVCYRNPGTGIPPKMAHTLLGKRAMRNISADELLLPDMFE
jgi:sialic acid synthase SpsE